jgi:Na+/H+ antiporter NhaC
MKEYEDNAKKGDLFTSHADEFEEAAMIEANPNGKVVDLVLPVIVLIAGCIGGMIYSGGFFSGVDLIDAFANASASVGLVIGGFIGLVFTFFFYMFRGVLTFEEYMSCFTEGFKQMVSPILILTFAWTLAAVTKLLGASVFVGGVVASSAGALQAFLPAVIFLVGMSLAFATGTSWGTFGILIPICLNAFPLENGNPLSIICVSACMAGAVCGDHCSPISDTTIMSSAGAQCDHIAHVSTQMPYAMTAAAISFVTYIVAGFVKNWIVSLIVGIAVMVVVIFMLNYVMNKSGDKEPEKSTT